MTVGKNLSTYQSKVVVQRDIIARPILRNVPFKAVAAGEKFEVNILLI